jgi:hypothetical protein
MRETGWPDRGDGGAPLLDERGRLGLGHGDTGTNARSHRSSLIVRLP